MTPHGVRFFVATASILLGAAVRPALAQEEWSTSPPLMRIGAGPEDEQRSYNVETIFIRDSVLYVADRSSAQIRGLHWRSGEVLYVGGRPGEGPSEFEWLTWADDCTTDSIIVYDAGARRLSVFSEDLEHLRTFALGAPDSTVRGLHLLPQTTRCAGSTKLLVTYLTVVFIRLPVDIARAWYWASIRCWTVDSEESSAMSSPATKGIASTGRMDLCNGARRPCWPGFETVVLFLGPEMGHG